MNQIKAGAVLSYISLALTNLVTILYTPFLLRMLEQSEYGLYSLVASVIAYLTVLDFGLGNAVVRYTTKYRTENKIREQYSLFGMFIILYTLISIISILLGFFLYNNIEILFGSTMSAREIGRAKIMLVILLFNVAINFPLSVFWSIIIAYERFIFQKILGIIRIIVQPLIMIPLLLWGYKAVAMVVVMTLVNIACLILDVYYCFFILKIKVFFDQFNWSFFKEISKYSYFVFIAFIADKIYINSGQFILGVLVGTTAIAIYSVAIQIRSFYSAISSAITSITFPKVVGMVSGKASELEISNFFIKIGRIQYFICGLIVMGFVLYGKPFINFWAGPKYSDSFIIAVIIIVPLTISLIQSVGVTILQAKNQQQFRSYAYVLMAVLGFCLSIPLTIRYGGVGCAIGMSIALLIGDILIVNIYYYKKAKIDIPLFWQEIGKISLFLLIPLFIGLVVDKLSDKVTLLCLLLKMVIFTISYMSVVLLFCLNKYEKNLLSSFVSKVKK